MMKKVLLTLCVPLLLVTSCSKPTYEVNCFFISVNKYNQNIEFDEHTTLYVSASNPYDDVTKTTKFFGKRIRRNASKTIFSNGLFYFELDKKYDRFFAVLGDDNGFVYCSSYLTKPNYGKTFNFYIDSGWQYSFSESKWAFSFFDASQFSNYFLLNIDLNNLENCVFGTNNIRFLNENVYSLMNDDEKNGLKDIFLDELQMTSFDYWNLCLERSQK